MARLRMLYRGFNPKKYEKEILDMWEREKVYEKVRSERANGPKFNFLDGPPYPSSDTPHPGTLWNKVMKDSVLRYWRSKGYNVLDRPGWDTHGLPIEVMTEKSLGFRNKKEIEDYGIANFVRKCMELVHRNVKSLTEHFKNFAVSMDWDNPYMTLEDSYIESAWWGLKKIWESGRLDRSERPVHWCPRCETVLSDYEVSQEYRDLMDPSIFVKFPVRGGEKEYILIWTTTPWTLPANVAVMVHPDEEYVKVKVGDEVLILARKRLDYVMKEAGVEDYEVIESFPGRELEGLQYNHPLEDVIPLQRKIREHHKVVLSEEFVTMEEGTGCVHSAPGHGMEDFLVGERYGLPSPSPVNSQGRFTEEVGKYKDLYVREANDLIIEDLAERGALFHKGTIVHRYPVCWRCKTPLIIRKTSQWYIRVVDLKEKLMKDVEQVNWVPSWAGERRFKDWLNNLRDWIISRQRYWGIPLPIWVCDKCGRVEVIGSVRELEEKSGRRPENLHRPWVDEITWKCEKCGGTMRRVPDITDVWFDSGISFYASFGYPYRDEGFEEVFPVDFITEGHDQIRGWFFSLLRVGDLLFGRAPYKSVLMHGFFLDERGREMSKSLGNFVPPEEIVERFGRDVFRVTVLTKVPWQDLRFSWDRLKETQKRLSIVWNVYVFATTYLRDMELGVLDEVRDPVNRWLLSRFNSTLKKVYESMERYYLHDATNALLDFFVEDLSRLYVRVARKKLRSKDEGVIKEWANALYMVLRDMLPVLAIYAPLTAEEIYQKSFRQEGDPESVNMLLLPEVREDLISKELEDEMDLVKEVVSAIGNARSKAKVRKRIPLKKAVVVGVDNFSQVVGRFKDVLQVESNVKEIVVGEPPQGEGWTKADFSRGEVFLYTEVGEEELIEGLARELIRRIQEMRKELGLTIGLERIEVYIQGGEAVAKAVESYREDIAWDSDADLVKVVSSEEEVPSESFGKEWDVNGERVYIWVRRK